MKTQTRLEKTSFQHKKRPLSPPALQGGRKITDTESKNDHRHCAGAGGHAAYREWRATVSDAAFEAQRQAVQANYARVWRRWIDRMAAEGLPVAEKETSHD